MINTEGQGPKSSTFGSDRVVRVPAVARALKDVQATRHLEPLDGGCGVDGFLWKHGFLCGGEKLRIKTRLAPGLIKDPRA